jgi:hypothetical protein
MNVKKSLRTEERGLSHVLLVLLLVLVLAGVGFAGWRVLHKDKVNQSAAQGSSGSSCMDAYHDQTLCNFETAYADFSKLAFTAVDNSTDSMSQTSQITIKIDGKGNSSISSQAGNQTTNSIMIGNTTYVQNGDSWIKYTAAAPAVSNPAGELKLRFSSPSTPKDKRINYKKLGKEQCGDATCYKYQVSGPVTSGTTYIWINSGNYRLQRMTIKTSDGTDDISVTYGPVTITAPSPTTTPADASEATYQSWMQNAEQSY